MGRLRAFARKLVEAAQSLQEEAKHPGLSPGHKRPEKQLEPEPARRAPTAGTAASRTDRPWFAEGGTDGWDETDPK